MNITPTVKSGDSKAEIPKTKRRIIKKNNISYSHKPLYLFGGAGMFLGFVSMLILFFLVIRRLVLGISAFDSPLFTVGVMFMIMGFQSVLMGLIAELQVRTYHEAQSKPTYTLRRVINGRSEEQSD